VSGIILVERDASRAIEFNSPDSPTASGGGLGWGRVGVKGNGRYQWPIR
jgi:hypothetical protein